MEPSDRVSAAEIGEWLSLHERQVRKLAECQVIARNGHGRYELKRTVATATAHLREVAAGRASLGTDGEELDLVPPPNGSGPPTCWTRTSGS